MKTNDSVTDTKGAIPDILRKGVDVSTKVCCMVLSGWAASNARLPPVVFAQKNE